MSLNTNTNNKKQKKSKLEESVEHFRMLVSNFQKKQALVYYNNLDKEIQKYIKNTPLYSLDLKSASIQF